MTSFFSYLRRQAVSVLRLIQKFLHVLRWRLVRSVRHENAQTCEVSKTLATSIFFRHQVSNDDTTMPSLAIAFKIRADRYPSVYIKTSALFRVAKVRQYSASVVYTCLRRLYSLSSNHLSAEPAVEGRLAFLQGCTAAVSLTWNAITCGRTAPPWLLLRSMLLRCGHLANVCTCVCQFP